MSNPTPWCSKAFFLQKPGIPYDDPSVRLTNLKPVNKVVDKVGYLPWMGPEEVGAQ